jgi:hypothetical protein
MNTLKHLIGTLVFLSSAAHAEFLTGNDLLSKMNHSDVTEKAIAMGYVAGVYDAGRGVHHCPPANVTLGQIHEMVKNTIVAAPSLRHHSADQFVLITLETHWPCPKKKNNNSSYKNT